MPEPSLDAAPGAPVTLVPDPLLGAAPGVPGPSVPDPSLGAAPGVGAVSVSDAVLAAAPDALPTAAPEPASEAAPGASVAPVPEPSLGAAPGVPVTPVPQPSLDAAPSVPVPPVPEPFLDTAPSPHETPHPLHAPDAYSTPPYGQPGPWAPAPPVQHPGVAQGDPWARYDPWAASPLQQTGESVPSERQRKREWRKGIVVGALLLALVSGGVGGVVGVRLERHGIGGIELPQAPPEPPGRDADSVAGIAARALPSVVTLHVKGGSESGTGTGFVLDDLGHILTNNHVVQPAGSGGDITVVFNGGQAVKGEIVGRDAGYDLAVVRVKGVRNLTPLPLGNSDGVQVGDPVVAIGAPFDLSGTVTSGIISATERPITAGEDGSDVSYVDALQTDAPINPGNSGGPLLDARGRVIGINSAIRSASGADTGTGQSGSVGLGFAIPVNQGKRIAEELIRNGRATHPIIGITLDLAYTGDGARVRTDSGEAGPPVTVGGPGDLAGIEPGDVITEVDGKPVNSSDELIVKVRAHRPGDELRLTVVRGGKTMSLSLVLGSAGG
ncbi:trypsin-like peptidase domain-containing protein [Streptomyces acidiscabies]|uniref:S1C family serine protease n=1 Tax=Streptomyces acidiscabies TaxID=42234 RepID=UPI0038F81183